MVTEALQRLACKLEHRLSQVTGITQLSQLLDEVTKDSHVRLEVWQESRAKLRYELHLLVHATRVGERLAAVLELQLTLRK